MNEHTPPPDSPSPDRDSKPKADATSDNGAGSEAPGRSGSQWEEPRPSGSGWEEPRTGGAGSEEPRPRREHSRAEDSDEARRRQRIEENVKSKSTWLRLVFIVLFAVILSIAEFVLTAVIVIQFLWVLFDGEPNDKLRGLGQSLARYAYQIIRYLTFNSDERPFPIDLNWPSDRPERASG